MADGGYLHPHVQRAAVRGEAHRVRRDVARLAARQDQRLRARRWPPRGIPRVLRGSRRDARDPESQSPREGRQYQRGAQEHERRIRGDLRLRPHSHALVPAGLHGLVHQGPEARDAADAPLLLFARSVREEPQHVPGRPQRRRAVLRPRAGRQRPVERHVLLRFVRGHPARAAARGRRHRDRDRDRGRAHRAQAAPQGLRHRLPRESTGGGSCHGKSLRPRGPAHPLGARHGADLPARQPVAGPRAEAAAAAVLPQRDAALPLRSPTCYLART